MDLTRFLPRLLNPLGADPAVTADGEKEALIDRQLHGDPHTVLDAAISCGLAGILINGHSQLNLLHDLALESLKA